MALVLAWLALAASPAIAGPVLDRVKAANALACGAEERAGIAEADDGGVASGLAVDLCRAVAVAVLGPQGKIAFKVLDSAKDFDGLRRDAFDLVVLSGGTILSERLADHLLLGPPVYAEAESLMVPETSPVQGPRDLQGKSVCFMIGTGAERAMETVFERDHVSVKRSGYQEDVELRDAYNVGRCQAVAGNALFLAEVRQDGGVHHVKSRILDTPLALDPLFLATGLDDARWSAVTTWTFQALLLASAPRSGFSGAGADPLAGAATPLGFREGWLKDVTASVGSYADIVRKNLGDGSNLHLAPGPNAAWPAGLMLPPASP